jgi:uncharacterized protein
MAEVVLDGLPPFRPRLPWWGPDLQTIRSVVVKSRALDGHAGERLYFPFADGSDDRLAAVLNRPATATTKPLIALVHGLTGLEDSFYMRESAAHFLARGFPVLRLNLRGAGRSRPHCRTQYHAGSSDDLAHVFGSLPAGLAPLPSSRRRSIWRVPLGGSAVSAIRPTSAISSAI